MTISDTGLITSKKIILEDSGNNENVRIGDDAWIGDMNVSNTIRIKGVQDATQGYIVFGTSDTTALGRTGTGALTYGGNTVWHSGNDGTGSGLDADKLDGLEPASLSVNFATSAGSATTFTSTTQNSQFNSIGVGTAASNVAGEIRATSNITAFYSASDIRLKENIVKLDKILPKLNNIDTYNFNYKTRPDQKMIGVIAQELIQEFPELVYETAPIDENTGLEKTYAVRYDLLSVVALQAVKELTQEINELKQRWLNILKD